MARMMLFVGMACSVLLLNPQWSARQLDLGLSTIGWNGAGFQPQLNALDFQRERKKFKPVKPARS